MSKSNSPLRYPGGKGALTGFLSEVIALNGFQDGVYVESFAGGAGAALNLLFSEYVDQIVLNDADHRITAFWKAVLNQTAELTRMIREVPVTIAEWRRQREVYRSGSRRRQLDLAFATFFLNRCNRSGILVSGGPIGGYAQEGKWKLGARYNRVDLIRRIQKVAAYRGRVAIHNSDAIEFLRREAPRVCDLGRALVYLDPPYYSKGSQLYLSYYQHEDHVELAKFLRNEAAFQWLMTYDDVPEIRDLYAGRPMTAFELDYSAHTRRRGRELLIWSDDLNVPQPYAGLPV